jgi:hypothetical protein
MGRGGGSLTDFGWGRAERVAFGFSFSFNGSDSVLAVPPSLAGCEVSITGLVAGTEDNGVGDFSAASFAAGAASGCAP